MNTSLVENIGIEVEAAQVTKDSLRRIANRVGWRLVEDGSCRSYRQSVGHIPVEEGGTEVMFGGELVSPIIDTTRDGWRDNIVIVLDGIRELGEGLDLRTSTHIHINCNGLPLFAIHSLIRMCAYLETAIYRISCAEHPAHRGVVHLDHGYARPLDGAPVTGCGDALFRQVFTVDTLLKTKNLGELRMALGRHDLHGGSKYHEARYTWLNLVPLFTIGSVEFRLFNSTFRPSTLFAWIDLCKSMVQMSFGKGTVHHRNPLGTSDITLEDMVELLMIDDEYVYTLENLWNTSQFLPPVRGHQRGHLGYMTNWRKSPKHLVPQPIDPDDTISFEAYRNHDPIVEQGIIKI